MTQSKMPAKQPQTTTVDKTIGLQSISVNTASYHACVPPTDVPSGTSVTPTNHPLSGVSEKVVPKKTRACLAMINQGVSVDFNLFIQPGRIHDELFPSLSKKKQQKTAGLFSLTHSHIPIIFILSSVLVAYPCFAYQSS